MSKLLISYAQNREDLLLWVLLHSITDGFYVDVGANDPTMDSVTKFFYDRGWHGINIEPIPSVYERLKNSRPKDINLNIGVSDKAGELTIREYTDGWHGWSTFSSKTKKAHANKKHKDYTVPVASLSDIFNEHGVKEIDFLKVDVEGLEYEVLSGNDWQKYRPKVIVAEGNNSKWKKLLIDLKYTAVFFDGLNNYFVRNDLTNIHTMDDYVEVLLGGQVVLSNREHALNKQFKLANEIIDTLKSRPDLKSQLDSLNKDYLDLNNKWNQINQYPEEYFGLRALGFAAMRKSLMKLGVKQGKKPTN
jgi:FkbM family methyltransferase